MLFVTGKKWQHMQETALDREQALLRPALPESKFILLVPGKRSHYLGDIRLSTSPFALDIHKTAIPNLGLRYLLYLAYEVLTPTVYVSYMEGTFW